MATGISETPAEVASGTAEVSTEKLLRAAGTGDAAAWDRLVHRYHGLVHAKVRAFRLQEADALDATQMTWLRLIENLDQVWCPERLAGWLATTASRECLRILRQTKSTASPVELVAAHVADPSAGPEQHAVNADTARRLGSVVAELPPGRQVLVRELFTDNPRSYREVARCAGIPIGSIGPSRARALLQMRRMLVARGLAPEF